MKIVALLGILLSYNINAFEEARCNTAQNLNDMSVETHILRIFYREKIDTLADRNLLEPDTYNAVSEAIRTRPIHELGQLFGFIRQLDYENQHTI